ncbi:MAG: NYN domain-containing protein [Lachnospiraceae bacterium]|nr:NYN domain-containing protein [Lachnospiraceae bacterium]
MVNIALFIDGENIPARCYEKVMAVARKKGCVLIQRVFRRRNDPCTKKWDKAVANYKELKIQCIEGKACKNKIDKVIISQIKDLLYKSSKALDIIIVVTNDHGYSNIIEEIRSMGIEAAVIGTTNLSKRLKKYALSIL